MDLLYNKNKNLMTENNFKILVSKYLTNELNADDVLKLESLISSNEQYKQKFKDYIHLNSIINQQENNSSQTAFTKFLKTVEKQQKPLSKNVIKYVAIICGVILSVFSANYLMDVYEAKNYRASLVIPEEKIVLYAENGNSEEIKLDNKNAFTKVEGLKNNNSVSPENKKKPLVHKKTANLTLKVPYGKKFNLLLSDGTKVYLNSGSSITYPSSFEKRKNRIVELVGEAYFKVAKDKHKPFIVKTSTLSIRALGTEFNVSSYKNDVTNSITLVEGSVAVSKQGVNTNKNPKTLLLRPNQKIVVRRDKVKKLSKKAVANVLKDVSWINRELFFKNDKFIDITKKLERYFNVKIISKNDKLNNLEFTGTFVKQDIFQILDAFRVHTPFNYKVNHNTITIVK